MHAHYQPDAFGTLFGATPELLRFRRAVGYELVRVGISAGARTGEPAAVMMRPCSEAARRLLTQLRAELARDLPTQLSLMTADNELYLDPRLEPALLANLPAPAPLLDETIEEAVQAYLFGPRPWEASAYPIRAWVLAHQGALAGLPAVDQALIRGRVIERRGWAWVTRNAALPSLPAAMRALRRAMRALHDLVEAPR